MELKDVFGEIESDSAHLVHGRLLEWALTPPLWHAEAVGGRPHHQARAIEKFSALVRNHLALSASYALRPFFCPHTGLCLEPASGGFFFDLPTTQAVRCSLACR